jgi:hypothetical protein
MDFLICTSASESPNLGIFNFWIDGKREDEVSKILSKNDSVLANSGVTFTFASRGDKMTVDTSALRLCEISDQYNLFHFLEHYLQEPSLLVNSQFSNINIECKDDLIDKYWSFDDTIMQDILTKQKFSKSRKDLDELCASTGSSVRAVSRQVDNIKSVFRTVEETTLVEPLIQHIGKICLHIILMI